MHGMTRIIHTNTIALLACSVLTPLTLAQDNGLLSFSLSLHQHAQDIAAMQAPAQPDVVIMSNWNETELLPEPVLSMLGNTQSGPARGLGPAFGFGTNGPQMQPGQQSFNGFTGFRPKVDDFNVVPLPSGLLAGIGMLACLGGLRFAHRRASKA
jgi:hypothetical protein